MNRMALFSSFILPSSSFQTSMGMFSGKTGLVMGVANDRSIAWAMAEARVQGRRRSGLYAPPQPVEQRRVARLVEGRSPSSCCPATFSPMTIWPRCSQRSAIRYGKLDFLIHSIAFAPPDELRKAVPGNQPRRLAPGDGHQRIQPGGGHALPAPLMPDGGSIVTISYIGGETVIPNYNLMGVCKAAVPGAQRALSGVGPGAEKYPRQRD